jgi:hypothetical protein
VSVMEYYCIDPECDGACEALSLLAALTLGLSSFKMVETNHNSSRDGRHPGRLCYEGRMRYDITEQRLCVGHIFDYCCLV